MSTTPTTIELDFINILGSRSTLDGQFVCQLEQPIATPDGIVLAGDPHVATITDGIGSIGLIASAEYGVFYAGLFHSNGRQIWKGRFQVTESNTKLSALIARAPIEGDIDSSAELVVDRVLVDPRLLALIGSSGGGLTWATIAFDAQLIAGVGYNVNSLSLTQLQLPATATNGQLLSIYGMGSGGWRLNQAAGQQIRIGDKTTTIGVAGGVRSTEQGDWLHLTFLGGIWTGTGIQGNLEIN